MRFEAEQASQTALTLANTLMLAFLTVGGHVTGKLLAVPTITVPPGFKTATKQLLAHPVEKHNKKTIGNITAPSLHFNRKYPNNHIIGTLSNTWLVARAKPISLLGAGIS